MQLSDNTLSYIAGLYEARGSASVSPIRGLRLGINQDHQQTCDMLVNAFGGYTGCRRGKWRYENFGPQAEHFARRLLPFLRNEALRDRLETAIQRAREVLPDKHPAPMEQGPMLWFDT